MADDEAHEGEVADAGAAGAEVGIDEILEACDLLSERLETYLAQREDELPVAQESGDERYVFRVERGVSWSSDLLEVIDDVYERIGALRHNHNQLKWAREGKMV